jgi:hypothetical protein
MSEKDKNGNDQLSGFLRYHGNKMTDKERNAFERNLEKDPFAREASEGFGEIDPGLAEKDILKLRKQVKERTSGKQRILWYRIAASVAVLMILSSIFIIVNKRKPSEQIAYSPAPVPAKEIPVTPEQKKTPETILGKEPVAVIPEKSKIARHETQKPEIKPDKNNEVKKEGVSADYHEAVMVAKAEEAENAVITEKAMAPKSVLERETSGKSSQIRGKIISAEDNQPIPGASVTVKGTKKGTVTDTGGNFSLGTEEAANRVLVADFVGMKSKEFKAVQDTSLEIKLEPSVSALNEIVVVGYGAKRTDIEQENELAGYTPPRPVNGKADFDRYIQDNIRRPDTTTTGQRVVVVLNFVVNSNGKIDSIKAVRSPGKIFSDEAIRLIKEGPTWKPAEENGKAVSDDVRVRIVFK